MLMRFAPLCCKGGSDKDCWVVANSYREAFFEKRNSLFAGMDCFFKSDGKLDERAVLKSCRCRLFLSENDPVFGGDIGPLTRVA